MFETTSPTSQLRQEHQAFIVEVEKLGDIAYQLPTCSAAERSQLISERVAFLRNNLLPHISAEERSLYPDWVELVDLAGAEAFLIADHREIIALIDYLDESASSDVDQLQQLLYGLQALIYSHFQKEEELVFPSLDEQREDLTFDLLEKFEAAQRYVFQAPD